MNYYQRHIGDYLKDTAHLSLLEHGIYTRLLDVYYTKEASIPQDQAARLINARSKDEKAALDLVLGEFFTLSDGCYHQSRCDEEIAKTKEKAQTNRDNGKRGGRPKKQTFGLANENPTETQSVISGFSNDNPNERLPSNQYPITNTSLRSEGERDVTMETGSACKAMKQHGLIDVNPAHPTLMALLMAGITVPELEAAAQEAVKRGKGFAYALKTAEGRRNDAAKVAVADGQVPAYANVGRFV